MKKNISFLVILFFLCFVNNYPQDSSYNIAPLIAELSKSPNNSDIYYDIMKYYVKINQKTRAIDWLEKLLRSGFNDYNKIYNDSELANIIGFEKYNHLLKDYYNSSKERNHFSKNKVKTKLETEYKYSFGQLEENGMKTYLYKYNINGTLSEKILFDDKGKESWKWRFTYDKNYNVLELNEFNSTNKLSKSTKSTFDKRFNLLNYIQMENKENNFKYEFSYDKYDNIASAYCMGVKLENNIIKKKMDLLDFFYGRNPFIIKIIFDSYGKIKEQVGYNEKNEIEAKITTTSDTLGRIKEIKSYNYKGELEFITEFVEEDKSFIGDGKRNIVFTKYDDKNNLILEKSTCTFPDGRIVMITTKVYDIFGNLVLDEVKDAKLTAWRQETLWDNHANRLMNNDQFGELIMRGKSKYNNDLLIEENYESLYINNTKIYEYNSSGDLLSMSVSGELRQKNNYDKDNNLIEIIHYGTSNPDNSVKYLYTFYK